MRTITITRRAIATAVASLAALASAATIAASCAEASQTTASWAGNMNLTHLEIGDGKYTTSGAKKGWVYVCQKPNGQSGGIPGVSKPWVHGSTWNYFEKTHVSGHVTWKSTFKTFLQDGERILEGNGLPSKATGVFPVSQSDPAAQYDPNPNTIQQMKIDLAIPEKPKAAKRPGCVNMGPIGVMTDGATLFNALDAGGKDAAAREMLDDCNGHPQQQGVYHYHSLPPCIYSGPAGQQSKVIGWAIDGYPITGPRGPHGVTMTDAKLDKCHGTTSPIVVDGKRVDMYHYVATMQYPYTIGCFHGTSALAASNTAE